MTAPTPRWWYVLTAFMFLLGIGFAAITFVQQQAHISGGATVNNNVNVDVDTYIQALQHLEQHQPLYVTGTMLSSNFRYHPIFLVVFGITKEIAGDSFYVLWFIKNCITYLAAGWLCYAFIIKGMLTPLQTARLKLIYFPLLAVNAPWITNSLAFGNVNGDLFLFSTIAVILLLKHQDIAAGVVLAIICTMKPQWAAFVVLLPFLLNNWRQFARVILVTVVGYLLLNVFCVFALGAYGAQSILDYVRFLLGADANFNWQQAVINADPYQQSIRYLLTRAFGLQDSVVITTWVIKGLLVIGVLAGVILARRILARARDEQGVALVLMYCIAYPVGMLLLFEMNELYLAVIGTALLWVYLAGAKYWLRLLILILPLLYILALFPSAISIAFKLPDLSTIIPLPFASAVTLIVVGIVLLARMATQHKPQLVPEAAQP